jgi:hypothetical protein
MATVSFRRIHQRTGIEMPKVVTKKIAKKGARSCFRFVPQEFNHRTR